jgi:hypothetical protein
MTSLEGPRAKLKRAEQQTKVLYRRLLKNMDPDKYPIRADLEANDQPKPAGVTDRRPWIAFTLIVSEVPTFGPDIGLLTGEVLHNFRGALDHAAWILVNHRGKNPLTAAEARRVQFPLARKRENYWGDRTRLVGVPDKPYRTLIERYQPYHPSPAGRAMRWLRNLTDFDKHRIVLPAVTLPLEGKLNFSYERAAPIEFVSHVKFGREIKEGTKLATIVVAKISDDKVRVKGEGYIASVPIFPISLVPPIPGFDAISFEFALDQIKATCSEILDEVEGNL